MQNTQSDDPNHPSALRNKAWAFSELFWELAKRMALTGGTAYVAQETNNEGLRAFAGFMVVMLWFWGAQAIQRMFFSERPFVDTQSRRGCLMYIALMAAVIFLTGTTIPIVQMLAHGAPIMSENRP